MHVRPTASHLRAVTIFRPPLRPCFDQAPVVNADAGKALFYAPADSVTPLRLCEGFSCMCLDAHAQRRWLDEQYFFG